MNAPDKNALAVAEQSELVRLESVIEQGKETFVAVGTALCVIRDDRLYRATHGSFQCYCEERWQFSRVQAHRLIEAANVVKLLPIGNTLTTESQARELAKVPEDKRVEVLTKAKKNGDRITAKSIKVAAVEVMPPDDETVRLPSTQEIHMEEIKALWSALDTDHRAQFLQWTATETKPDPVPGWKCNECGETFDTDDEVETIYECGECSTKYTRDNSADGCSHRCPDCNKFGAKFSDQGCPECGEGELEKTTGPKAAEL